MASSPRTAVNLVAVTFITLSWAGMPRHAAGAEPARDEPSGLLPGWLTPDRALLQYGTANDLRTVNLGVIWEGTRSWRLFERTELSYYTETAVGRWWVDGHAGNGKAQVTNTQIGFTPTLRATLPGKLGAYVELGIGVNLITPVYRRSDKRFSTVFNFGDHIGIGMRPFGARGGELSLRVQHFSNAGIKHPNPGENFIQLRFSLQI